MLKRVFPLWTVLVAVVGAVSISGRFAEHHQLFDVTVTGDGRPIILVPGLATSGAVWDETVAALEDRYELHVLTLAGFGGPSPVGSPFLPRVADAILEYVDERRLQSPVIVGHSLGGYLAFAAASQKPGVFGGVVAVDGVPFLPALLDPAATPSANVERAAAMRTLYASMTPDLYRQQTRMALASMITAPADVDRAMAWGAGANPAAVGIAVAEMMTDDKRLDVARIKAPVLLMGAVGAIADPLRERARQAYRDQVKCVPDATVVFAEQARHFVMLDDPGFFKQTLHAFLDRVSSRDGDATADGRAEGGC